VKIFHVPGTRSVRPVWLCFELGLEVEVVAIDFSLEYRNSEEWRAISPAGKIPALVDGDLRMFESGAMMDHILATYADGRLCPKPGTIDFAHYRQWSWFAEATLIRPLGLYRILRAAKEPVNDLIEEAQRKFHDSLASVETQLNGGRYLLGEEFCAADIMMGYSVGLAEPLLDDRYPNLRTYFERLKTRDAYIRVAKLPGFSVASQSVGK